MRTGMDLLRERIGHDPIARAAVALAQSCSATDDEAVLVALENYVQELDRLKGEVFASSMTGGMPRIGLAAERRVDDEIFGSAKALAERKIIRRVLGNALPAASYYRNETAPAGASDANRGGVVSSNQSSNLSPKPKREDKKPE